MPALRRTPWSSAGSGGPSCPGEICASADVWPDSMKSSTSFHTRDIRAHHPAIQSRPHCFLRSYGPQSLPQDDHHFPYRPRSLQVDTLHHLSSRVPLRSVAVPPHGCNGYCFHCCSTTAYETSCGRTPCASTSTNSSLPILPTRTNFADRRC